MHKLYQENFQSVLAYIMKNNGNKEQAEDVYQEAFLAAWRNIQTGRFRPQGEHSFNAYLFRIAKNKWIDFLRSGMFKNTVALPESIQNENGEQRNAEDEHDDEYINLIIKNFERLGAGCKDLLIRFYYKKNSMKQIAAHLKCTEGTARNKKYKCLKRLRELINNNKP